MKTMLALLLAATLAGCASQPPAPLEAQAKAGSGFAAFATLAPLNSLEFQTAAAYTQLAFKRHLAAKMLRQGKIGKDQAIALQSAADAVRADLDAAVKAKSKAAAKKAAARVAELDQFLE